MIRDVTEADFQQQVVERSKQVPVVVDFWAEWCGPCRTLGPAIEKSVSDRAGKVELAKVDVDGNKRLAASFRVQGIPAVKAFRNGEVVDEFTGALPPAQIDAFLDRLVPSEEELLVEAAIESGDESALRQALSADPDNAGVTIALARLLLARGAAGDTQDLTAPLAASDFIIDGLNARAGLEASADPSAQAFRSWDEGDHEAGLEALFGEAEGADPDRQDLLRRVMVGWFTELGPSSALASTWRRRLAAILT